VEGGVGSLLAGFTLCRGTPDRARHLVGYLAKWSSVDRCSLFSGVLSSQVLLCRGTLDRTRHLEDLAELSSVDRCPLFREASPCRFYCKERRNCASTVVITISLLVAPSPHPECRLSNKPSLYQTVCIRLEY
jgi:hypothetical protein